MATVIDMSPQRICQCKQAQIVRALLVNLELLAMADVNAIIKQAKALGWGLEWRWWMNMISPSWTDQPEFITNREYFDSVYQLLL